MRRFRLFKYTLTALAGFALFAALGLSSGFALGQETGEIDAPSKAAAKPVNAGDLMKAMKQGLAAPPTAAHSSGMAAPAVTPPPIPSMPPPATRAAPVVTSPATPATAPATTKTQAPPPKVETPAVKESDIPVPAPARPEQKPLTATPAPKPAPAPVKTPEPETETAVEGPPLLTDVEDAPAFLGKKEPAVRETASMPGKMPERGPEFSKPRPLFLGKSGKRAGVVKKTPAAPEVEIAPKEESLPPITPPPQPAAKPAPAEKAVTEEKPAPQSTAAAKPEPEKDATPQTETQTESVSESEPVSSGAKDTFSSGEMSAPPASELEGTLTYSQEAGKKPVIPATIEESSGPDPGQEPGTEEKPAAAPDSPPRASPAQRLHASCGAANGVGFAARPSSSLCTEGTPSEVEGDGPWTWTCAGEKGGASVSCSAPLLVNGECGLANGSQSAAPPLESLLCRAGDASSVTGQGPWYWNCFGENGGAVAQCAAYTLIRGACGAAADTPVRKAPSEGLCASGKSTAVIGDGPWSWTCLGSDEDNSVNCTAPVRINGSCGIAHGMSMASVPTADLCATGQPSEVEGEGPWTWLCMGENGGTSMSCLAPVITNATCGPAHGLGVETAPTEGLCAEGRPDAVNGDGPWRWTCEGSGGGARADCMAPLKVDGACGPINKAELDEAPEDGLCASGVPGVVLGSGPWQWTCQGAGGGITSNCMVTRAVPAQCGTAHGIGSPTPPLASLCLSGVPTTVIGKGPWFWTCQNTSGSHKVDCMAPRLINGACGAAADAPHVLPPEKDFCRGGTASPVSGAGPWTWSCEGSGGGVSASCRALVADAPPPTPQTPHPGPKSGVPANTTSAGNECTPSVRRWTITCQQGGYPVNYAGVIIGETQVLCPTNVERGVWLSNSCAPSTDSQPVSPKPGVLVKPPPPKIGVTDVIPEIEPLSARKLKPKAKPRLATPRFKDAPPRASATQRRVAADGEESILFAPGAEGLDAAATTTLNRVTAALQGADKSIITLNAYAALPPGGDPQESRRLSLARALAARSYLMSRGIASTRIDVQALGPAGDGMGDDRVDIKIGGP